MNTGQGNMQQEEPKGIATLGRTHSDGFDWKLVTEFDPELVNSMSDTNAMNEIMTDFLQSTFSSSDMKIIQNPVVYRLIQHLQVIMNYLYSTQIELSSSLKKVSAQNRELKSEIEHKKDKINRLFRTCKELKESERCPVCRKSLKSQMYLEKHLMKRHASLYPMWDSLRTGKLPKNTQRNEDMKNQLDQIREMIEKQNNTLSNRSMPIQPKSTEEKKEHVPKINPFNTQKAQSHSKSNSEDEEIMPSIKARTAPVKPNDFDEPPPQHEEPQQEQKHSSDADDDNFVLDDVITLDPVQQKKELSEKIPPEVRDKAKRFVTRSITPNELDENIMKVRAKITDEMKRQSQVVRMKQEETKKEELRKLLEVDIKYIHPSPRRGATNNIADLRRPPKKYIPTIKELDLSDNSSVASYSTVTFVPEERSDLSNSTATVDSGSAVVKKDTTDKQPEKPNDNQSDRHEETKSENKNENEKEDNDEKKQNDESKLMSTQKSLTIPNDGSTIVDDEPKIVTKVVPEKKDSSSSKKDKDIPKKGKDSHDDDEYEYEYYDDEEEEEQLKSSKKSAKEPPPKSVELPKPSDAIKNTLNKKDKPQEKTKPEEKPKPVEKPKPKPKPKDDDEYEYYYYDEEEEEPPKPAKKPSKKEEKIPPKQAKNEKPKPKPKPKNNDSDEYYYEEEYDEPEPAPKSKSKPKPNPKASEKPKETKPASKKSDDTDSFKIEDLSKKQSNKNSNESDSFNIEDLTTKKAKKKDESDSFFIEDTTKMKPKTKPKAKKPSSSESEDSLFKDL